MFSSMTNDAPKMGISSKCCCVLYFRVDAAASRLYEVSDGEGSAIAKEEMITFAERSRSRLSLSMDAVELSSSALSLNRSATVRLALDSAVCCWIIGFGRVVPDEHASY